MMDVLQDLLGIIAVVNTPFTDTGEVDPDSIYRYVDHALNDGVIGFLISALASEVSELSFEERKLIAKSVIHASSRKTPVIGGTAAATQSERLQLAKMFLDCGCIGVLVNNEFRGETRYIQEISEFAEMQPDILMIQDWDFHGFGLPLELIVRLFGSIFHFNCLKVEVVPAGVKYTQILEATKGRLHVSGGWASSQMIEALDRGVHAFMPTVLHAVLSKIYHLHRQNQRPEAVSLFEEVLPILAFYHQHPDISIQFNKRLLVKQGVFKNTLVRSPKIAFDRYHERMAGELIDKALNILGHLK